MCQIILKSIHNCRAYGLGKFGMTDGRTCTELSLRQLCLCHRNPAQQKSTDSQGSMVPRHAEKSKKPKSLDSSQHENAAQRDLSQ